MTLPTHYSTRQTKLPAPATRKLAVTVACLALSACAVGPDFKTPAAPQTAGYLPHGAPADTVATPTQGGETQRFVAGMQIPQQWWQVFESPKLNALIEDALRASPTVAAAQAALKQAHENVKAQQGAYFPMLQASYSPSRQRNAVNTISPTLTSGDEYFTLHTAQLSISYTPDVFGLNRRQVESLVAQEDAQRFQLEATYLTLASSLAVGAIQEASLRAQLEAQRQIVMVNTRLLDNYRRQQALGYATGLDVAAAETQLAQAEQALPALQKQLDQQRDLLCALAGRLPAQGVVQTFTFDDFTLPQDLPLSLPSALVRQRPDVRAAEEQLHAATALVGVAIANMLPQLSLTGALGGSSTVFGQMLSDGNIFWSLTGNAAQTLFAGGTLLARKRAADAAVLQAEAEYRSTVIGAFQNVADTLHALDADARTLQAALKSEQAAKTTLDITSRQLQLGQVNAVAVWNAEQAYQTAVQSTIQARASRYADTAALFQSLGGGWWNVAQADKANG